MYLHDPGNPNSPYAHVGNWAIILTNTTQGDRVVCGTFDNNHITGATGMFTRSNDPRPEYVIWYPVRLFSDK